MSRKEEFKAYIEGLNAWDGFVLQRTTALHREVRRYLANKYLSGDGLEIGAQNIPVELTTGRARVKYIDRIPKEESAALHELPLEGIVTPDFCLEADSLTAFNDNSIDFIIANHILEHTEDPVSALAEWFRVLRPNGVLFLSVPNYLANEYDFRRHPVEMEHLITVHQSADPSGRWQHKIEHWKENIIKVEDIGGEDPRFNECLQFFMERDYRIHFHVFDLNLVEQMLEYIRGTLSVGINIVDAFYFHRSYEILVVIRKGGADRSRVSIGSLTRSARNILILVYLSWPGAMRKIRRTLLKPAL